ncbi:MAG: hypothetical protein M9941_15450 [Anaerolineae bacterium]|nr:hypothetical protein [Anaerolineae bacterium]
MTIKLGLTTENINTQYAPLAALFAHYQQNQVLKPLERGHDSHEIGRIQVD